MKPLTLDDLIPLEEFAARRAEFLDAHLRYCNRYRRVRVGPSATLLFENRQTLWFRMQEVLRIARVTELEMVQLELDWYNQLLPARDHLQAALILDGGLTCSAARLRLDTVEVTAKMLTSRPEDRAAGAAQWLEFEISTAQRKLLRNRRFPACFEIDLGDQHFASADLTTEMRQSLLDDLRLAQRKAA